MTEERIDVITESNSAPVISESDSILDQQDETSAPLVPATESILVTVDNAEPKRARRMYSTGNITLPYARENVLSRYLSPSSGSCHDYCKHGLKNARDIKTRSQKVKRSMVPKGDGLDVENALTLAVTKKKLEVSSTPNLISKSQKPDIPVATKSKVSSSTKKQDVLSKQLSLNLKIIDTPAGLVNESEVHMQSRSSSLLIKECSENKEEGETHENREIGASLLKHGDPSSKEKDELKGRKELRTTLLGKKKVPVRATTSLPARHFVKRVLMRQIISVSPNCSAKKILSKSAGNFSNLKGLLEDQRKIGHAESEQPSIEHVPGGTIGVVESSKVKAVKATEIFDHSTGLSPSLSSKSADKNSKQPQSATRGPHAAPPAKKILRHVATRVHITQTPPSSERKTRRQAKDVPRSSKSLTALASFESTKGSASFESHETKSRAVNAKVEFKNKPRKDGVIGTKDKGSPAKKLNFRQGKVVELQPVIRTPRRLKFRRRVPADCQFDNNDSRKGDLKKTEVDEGGLAAGKSESEKVALRHQDVRGKKVVKSLLNNVIEETANKLVETRKSKVKALVGAFETVISLQDSKPTSVVSAC